MPVQMPKYIFESAAHESEVFEKIEWKAAESFESVYSAYCPALRGSDGDFMRFYAMLVYKMIEEDYLDSESALLDLAERVVRQPSGRQTLYGFAGLDLIT